MIIISAFPGLGKSYLHRLIDSDYVLDSDSSTFDKSGFPNNYMEHIESVAPRTNLMFVSSHDVVRAELAARKIPYFLCYPAAFSSDDERGAVLKAAYMKRYVERGSPQPFLDLMDKNFEQFSQSCAHDNFAVKVPMFTAEGTLADALLSIVGMAVKYSDRFVYGGSEKIAHWQSLVDQGTFSTEAGTIENAIRALRTPPKA